MKQCVKRGRSAAWLAAASATVIVLNFGATGSHGGVFVEPETAQVEANPPLTAAVQADWADWLEFYLLLKRLEFILSEPLAPPGEEDGTQEESVARAQSQSERFEASGVHASLSVAELDEGLAVINDLRQMMSAYSVEFTDPYWTEYAGTLDAIEWELDAQTP